MYTWAGDIDLHESAASNVVMIGDPPSDEVTEAWWSVKIRVHSNAVGLAQTYITIFNGSDLLYSDPVAAEQYEVDPSWPEWRQIATFRGSFGEPIQGTFSDWFSGVSSVSLWGISTNDIPGGIAQIVYAEVSYKTDSGAWELVRYNNGVWEAQEAVVLGGSVWQPQEPFYIGMSNL